MNHEERTEAILSLVGDNIATRRLVSNIHESLVILRNLLIQNQTHSKKEE